MTIRRPISEADVVAYRQLLKNELGVRVVEKETSKLMKFFAVFVHLFNKEFMERYITTIGKTIHWPRMGRIGKNPSHDMAVLFHEGQHAYDFQHHPMKMWCGYPMPQWLVLLSMLSVLSIWLGPWWCWWLVCLGLIAPLPAPGRLWAEMRGYSCTIAFRAWTRGEINHGFFEYIARQFTNAHYYYMWPFPKDMMRRLANAEQKVRRGNLTTVQRMTYVFLEERGVIGG